MGVDNFQYFLIGTSRGSSERGDWYRITLNISENTSEGVRDYVAELYVDAVMYGKCQAIKKFSPVDAAFVPSASGRARLVSIESL